MDELKEVMESWQNRSSHPTPGKRLNEQSASPQSDASESVIRGLTSRPLIPTKLTPDEIVGDEWIDIYINHLKAYTKSGLPWGAYAAKHLGFDEKAEFARIGRELREHGFYGQHVEGDRLVCYTAVEGKHSGSWSAHRKGCHCGLCRMMIFTREDYVKNR